MGNIDLIEDACQRLAHTTRKMFGGFGLFAPNGGMFAGVVTDDEIILKFADEPARNELVALGGHPWVYDNKMTMREWIVIPDTFYDEPAQLSAWAARAYKLVPPKKEKRAAAKGAAKAPRRAPPPKPAAKKSAAKKSAAKRR